MENVSYIKLCRLCLEEPKGEISCLINQEIKDVFIKALPDVHLIETETLSQIVCQDCMNLIHQILNFKRKIRKNQEFLLRLVQKRDNNEQEGLLPGFETYFWVKEEPIEEENIHGTQEQTRPSKKAKKDLEKERTPEKTQDSQNKSDKVENVTDESDHGTSDRISESESDEMSEKNTFQSKVVYPQTDKKSESKSDKLPLFSLIYEKDSKYVLCPICKGSFEHESYLQKHGRRRHPEYDWEFEIKDEKEEEKYFNCDRCDKNFSSEKKLFMHNEEQHRSEIYPFSCDLCISSRFVSQDILELHKKRHEHNKDKKRRNPFACQLCELRFTSETILDKHMKHHEKNLLDSCQICGMTVRRNYIFGHMTQTHFDKTEFVCHFCGKSFKRENHLKIHLEKHEPAKPYTCTTCGLVMKRKSEKHIKMCSKPKEEFLCRTCGQVFPSFSKRNKHETVHHGTKCKTCQIQFNNYHEFKKHKNTMEHKLNTNRTIL